MKKRQTLIFLVAVGAALGIGYFVGSATTRKPGMGDELQLMTDACAAATVAKSLELLADGKQEQARILLKALAAGDVVKLQSVYGDQRVRRVIRSSPELQALDRFIGKE